MTQADQPLRNEAEKPEREIVRDKRRAEALRANLKRRKAQLRGRADDARQSRQHPEGVAEPAKDMT